MKIITKNTLREVCCFLENCDNFVFLDTSKPDGMNQSSLMFVEPVKRLQHHEGEDATSFLQELQRWQEKGHYVAGWFSYEFGYLLEANLNKKLCRPEDKGSLLADLSVFERCHFFDHQSAENTFPSFSRAEKEEREQYSLENLSLSQSEDEYIEALEKVLSYIKAGDTYQVNYTLKLLFDFHGSFSKFYRDLRRNQSVSYGGYIRFGNTRVMSFSPELFFWKKGSRITVRPMKGTVKRGRTLQEDEALRNFLRTDLKNQSENVMIVDLLRNDLGRLMHRLGGGDVRVDSLFDVETYETLLQMTSTIRGSTKSESFNKSDLGDFFKAIYPCGSVTGAPKIRTMEIIDELESGRRGVYTGAIGYLAPNGDAVFNVPIRTVVFDGRKGEMGIGSGIVHDSDPSQEWQECLLKGKFLTSPQRTFELLETLLWTPDNGFLLFDRHLRRLQSTAKFFLFSVAMDEVSRILESYALTFAEKSLPPQRLRLLVSKDGKITVEYSTCSPPYSCDLPVIPESHPANLPQVGISERRTDSQSCWFYHKTTNRSLYDEEYEKAQAQGLVDVIFENENGLITEGCISNIIIFRDGTYVTPPLNDGLLAGVMREQLLAARQPHIAEESINRKDLQDADALFLCNSVRGITRVRL